MIPNRQPRRRLPQTHLMCSLPRYANVSSHVLGEMREINMTVTMCVCEKGIPCPRVGRSVRLAKLSTFVVTMVVTMVVTGCACIINRQGKKRFEKKPHLARLYGDFVATLERANARPAPLCGVFAFRLVGTL